MAFNTSLGFRGGLRYDAAPNFWDTRVYWTHLGTEGNKNVPSGLHLVIPEFFSGFLALPDDLNLLVGGDIDWKFAINMFDLDISHKISIGDSFILQPSLGLKGGSIYQTMNIAWNGIGYISHENVQHNFLGIGPSFGIEAEWNLYKAVKIVANFSAAWMWGKWNVDDIYQQPEILLIIPPKTISTSMDDNELGTMMYDYFLGLEYEHQGRSQVKFKLGYETQFWANQFRLTPFQLLPVHGDLTLQGATCGISIAL